ncbi:MAG: diacylglycerol kinase [Ndongobacter sp.]|nr:diacylglycerol kinase [Ndongobacter sp.]
MKKTSAKPDPEWEEKKRKSWQRKDYFFADEADKKGGTQFDAGEHSLDEEVLKQGDTIRNQVRTHSYFDSFGHASDGILYAVIRERNMRFDMIIAGVVLFISLFFNFSKVEFALLSITVVMVLAAEMFNTAIEALCDLIVGEKQNSFVKIAKDVAAGATLLTAANAVVVAYLLFFHKFAQIADSLYERIRLNWAHSAFICVALTLVCVILAKAFWYRGHGRPLHGGSVSGHTALAFCLATMAAFVVHSTPIAALSYLLALLVAESRYEAHIHTVGELVLGAMLGTSIAALIMLVFAR